MWGVFLREPRDSENHWFVHIGKYPSGNLTFVPTTFEHELNTTLNFNHIAICHLELL